MLSEDDEPPEPGCSKNNRRVIDTGNRSSRYYEDSEVDFAIKSPYPGPTNEVEAMEFLEKNPHLGNVFRRMIKDGIQEDYERWRSIEPSKGDNGRDKQTQQKKASKTNKGMNKHSNSPIVKSPSDTTIYVPALRKQMI